MSSSGIGQLPEAGSRRPPVQAGDTPRGLFDADTILSLQRVAGNAAVARLVFSGGQPVAQRDPRAQCR